ncbi:MAG: hypothetical protein HRU19_25750 [Pseudobacteriovorax sp.]|nr:hypothetical protein [Pseudobacteriovorax sp.]
MKTKVFAIGTGIILSMSSFADESSQTSSSIRTRLTTPGSTISEFQSIYEPMGVATSLSYAESGQTEFSLGYVQNQTNSESIETNTQDSNKVEVTQVWESVSAATVGNHGAFFWGLNASAINLNIDVDLDRAPDFSAPANTLNVVGHSGIAVIGLKLGYFTVTGTNRYLAVKSDSKRHHNRQNFAMAFQTNSFELGMNHERTQEKENFRSTGYSSIYTRFSLAPGHQMGLTGKKLYNQSISGNHSQNFVDSGAFIKDSFVYQLLLESFGNGINYELGLKSFQQSYAKSGFKSSSNIRRNSLIAGLHNDLGTGHKLGASLLFEKGDDDKGSENIEDQTVGISLIYGLSF